MRLPQGAEATAPKPLTLAEVPGAAIAYHRAWRVADVDVIVACATRDVPLWIDGLTPSVLGGLNGLARRHLALTIVRPGAAHDEGAHVVQSFTGVGDGVAVVGRHRVGFADDHTLLACTAVCRAASSDPCEAVMTELEVEPGFVVRSPSHAERGLSAMLAHPRATVVAALGALLLGVLVLLSRRPREAELSSAAASRKKGA